MTADLTAATIEGGAGPLNGTVTLTGAKNIALKALCLSALCTGRTTLRNMPANTQNAHIVEVLDRLGATARTEPEEGRGLQVTYDAGAVSRFDLDPLDVLRCRHTLGKVHAVGAAAPAVGADDLRGREMSGPFGDEPCCRRLSGDRPPPGDAGDPVGTATPAGPAP